MNTHEAWEKIHKSKNWGAYPSEHIIRFVARNYYNTDRKNIKILDFGCGTGANSWYLAREGFDTYAFDISECAIEKLLMKFESENLKIHAKTMDGLFLDYDDNYFDAVIDNVSIFSNKSKDIKQMYGKVYDILKNGGKFITVVFDKETTGYGTGHEVEPGTYEGIDKGRLQGIGYRHFFDRDELFGMLSDVGFKNINIDFIKYSDNGDIVSQLVTIGEK
mgnify:CR=1 FL=1|nr:class I SAM-dependent methyltransferase [uncultured Agathobacter sp.]